ncbi:MAG TPA: VCBS repeat-containing protein, partial [Crenotrichaceae bacterium]|nr:VCBS repeat-containing protein [Crenotrichaceae bacterium]
MSYRWHTIVFILLSVALGLVFLYLTPLKTIPLKTIDYSPSHFQFYSNISKKPVFSDITAYAGLVVSHMQGGEKITNLTETLGAGACVLDFDNDGWLDIFFITGSGQTRYYGRREWWQQGHSNVLYKNNGNGQFVDVTKRAGLENTVWGMGCASADFDNDGDADLFVTSYGSNIFYENRNGRFVDISPLAGIKGEAWSTSVVVADYNKDGLLDIYVVNYLDFKNGAKTYEKTSGFQRMLPVSFDARVYDGQANQLYLNKGKLKFEDVTSNAGVANVGGRGLAAQWVDLNRDSYPDLIVSNDAGLPNAVFLNKYGETFINASLEYPLNSAEAT